MKLTQLETISLSDVSMYRIILILNVYLFTGRLTMSLVMEYLPFGSLIGYLESNRHNVSPRRLLLFASQICKVRVREMGVTPVITRGGNEEFKCFLKKKCTDRLGVLSV